MVLIPGWLGNGLSSESLIDLPQVTQTLLTSSFPWFLLDVHDMA